jgi:outer membrane receptor for ferrienterochelin and colicins
MSKRMIPLTLAGLLIASSTWGIGRTITGIVKDSETGMALPGVSVQLEGTSLGDVADLNGFYEISCRTPGQYTIIVSAVGYKTLTKNIVVSDSQSLEFDFELTQTPLETSGIVVTGTRTPRYIKEVPVFTEVITHASIEDKSAHNLFEALEGESGVRVEQQCQACNFSILRMQGLGADHTQVLIDGQPVYSGLASVYGLQQLSTADIDRIEVVKGAGSALYGSNAVAGAINIISSVPLKTQGQIGIEIGDHGTNKYQMTAGARQDQVSIFLFAQQSRGDEIDETGDINAPGGIDEPDGWIDRVRSNVKNAGFNLFIDDVIDSDQLVLRGRVMNETRQGGWLTDNLFENPFAPGTERIITDGYTVQLDYHTWLPSGNEISADISLTRHQRNATNDTFLSDYEEAKGELPPLDLMRPYIADENLLVATLNYVHPLLHNHRLLTGIQLTRNELKENGKYLDTETEEPYTSTSNKEAYEVGAYLQDEFQITDRLELVAGLRFDYHTSEDNFRGSGDIVPQGLDPLEYNETTFNPRFAIKFEATDNLVLRSAVGTGFRVPYGFSEDLHLCSGSPRVYKGGSLKPEKSRSYSITADYTELKWNASLNLYRTELKDAIAFAEADDEITDLGYTYQWENIDDAFVMGAEFSGSYALMSDLALGVRFEHFKGEYDNPRDDWVGTEFEETSKKISRFPQTSGGFKFEYTPSSWGFVLHADYKGKMYIDLSEPVDPADVKIHKTESFVTFDAKLSKTLFNRYRVYVGAKNLTDYTQREKHIDDAAFMYAPVYGRIVFGGLQVSL